MERREKLIRMASEYAAQPAAAAKYAEHLEELFDVIVPERIGGEFSQALREARFDEAVRLCAAYYRKKPHNNVAKISGSGDYSAAEADKAIMGIMREVNIDWVFPDGQIDFLFDPTELKGPRNHEWLWQFNRHGYWANMARAYTATGDEKYAEAFEKQLLRWIEQTEAGTDWNAPGSAWRTIECGIRLMGSWQAAFDGFKGSPSVSDFSLLLMIASMHRQSLHLLNHSTQGNWLMMELSGVYTFSGLFDELSDAERNRGIAAERLLEEMEKQILPDGMHNELSPDYQVVVFGCGESIYSLAVSLGFAEEIPDAFVKTLERIVHSAVLLSTPDFTQPRTNDTYTITTERFTGPAEKLLPGKSEYRFVNSRRREGNPPAGETASAFLANAGFAVMRSDWTEEAAYLCFDVGPLGRGHMHQDKLNVNIYKGAEELLYDDGGGQYEISEARRYGISGYSHNIVLVDGMAQNRKSPLETTEPIDAGWISNESFDYAAASYDDEFGAEGGKPAVHTREVRFCKPGFFCIKDRMTSADGRKHSYEVLFHLDTTKVKQTAEYENGVISDYGRKYELLMIPLDEEEYAPQVKIVSAQTEPVFQGWYNGRNERNLHEAVTVSREVKDVENYQFTTLLFPVRAGDELPSVRKMPDGMAEVVFEGRRYRFSVGDLSRSAE